MDVCVRLFCVGVVLCVGSCLATGWSPVQGVPPSMYRIHGIDRWPHLWKVPRWRWISHTHPIWLWGHSLFKISSPGPVLYGTNRLLWRPHKQSPTFHSKCRINKGLIKMGSTIDHWRSRCIHSFIAYRIKKLKKRPRSKGL
jgi:hypothetical protein